MELKIITRLKIQAYLRGEASEVRWIYWFKCKVELIPPHSMCLSLVSSPAFEIHRNLAASQYYQPPSSECLNRSESKIAGKTANGALLFRNEVPSKNSLMKFQLHTHHSIWALL